MKDLGRKKVRVLIYSVSVAFLLTVLKVITAFLTHSMAILSSAADSFMDLLMSLINLFAGHKAEKPADENHPYGHGKIEHIAGLFQCFLMLLSVLYLLYEAIKRMIVGSHLTAFSAGISVMIFSIIISVLLVVKLRHVSRKTDSIILKTEELHFSSDILANIGVIGALVLVKLTGLVMWDLLISIVISVYIGYYTYKIGFQSVQELMDREAPKELQASIKDFVINFDDKIADIHKLRARKVGNKIFAEFHITIRNETDFIEAHKLTERIRYGLIKKNPGMEVTVHYDPEGIVE